jgi:aminoglycoside 3-N-acetyltransferase
MHEVSDRQVLETLNAVGIRKGDGLLIHSAVHFLGQPAGGIAMYYETISAVLEPDGTIAVPAFNFDFARGVNFDPQETPSKGMGVFSEYIRQLPETRRTPHPMQSLAVIGRYADDLAQRDTLSAFDLGSPFQRMLELDFKLLLLGADVQSVSILHYSEQKAAVPYRYWKEFEGSVRTSDSWQKRTYRLFARDLDLDPKISLQPVQERLQSQGLWSSRPLNYGKVAACRLVDFVSAVDDFLQDDPWSLVTNRP